MKKLLIVNGPAYGADETFNALRQGQRPHTPRGRRRDGVPPG